MMKETLNARDWKLLQIKQLLAYDTLKFVVSLLQVNCLQVL